MLVLKSVVGVRLDALDLFLAGLVTLFERLVIGLLDPVGAESKARFVELGFWSVEMMTLAEEL